MITAGLKKRGIQTIPAFDAMQAVMATMRSEPDAVIMDLNMRAGPASRRCAASRAPRRPA
jgi:DNA-binding response OmpR family regulator